MRSEITGIRGGRRRKGAQGIRASDLGTISAAQTHRTFACLGLCPGPPSGGGYSSEKKKKDLVCPNRPRKQHAVEIDFHISPPCFLLSLLRELAPADAFRSFPLHQHGELLGLAGAGGKFRVCNPKSEL